MDSNFCPIDWNWIVWKKNTSFSFFFFLGKTVVDVVGSGGSGGLFFKRGSSGGEWRLDRETFTWPSDEWLSILRRRLWWRVTSFRWNLSIGVSRGEILRPETLADADDDVEATAGRRWYCEEREDDDFRGGDLGPPRTRGIDTDLKFNKSKIFRKNSNPTSLTEIYDDGLANTPSMSHPSNY